MNTSKASIVANDLWNHLLEIVLNENDTFDLLIL